METAPRFIGVHCTAKAVYLAGAEGGSGYRLPAERIDPPTHSDEAAARLSVCEQFQRVLSETQPKAVRLVRAEENYEGAYSTVGRRARLEAAGIMCTRLTRHPCRFL